MAKRISEERCNKNQGPRVDACPSAEATDLIMLLKTFTDGIKLTCWTFQTFKFLDNNHHTRMLYRFTFFLSFTILRLFVPCAKCFYSKRLLLRFFKPVMTRDRQDRLIDPQCTNVPWKAGFIRSTMEYFNQLRRLKEFISKNSFSLSSINPHLSFVGYDFTNERSF